MLFKNGIGRPSNVTLRLRVAYFAIAILMISIIDRGVLYVKNNLLNVEISSTGKNAQLTKGNGDVASDENYS